MAFLPDAHTLALYLLACVVLFVTPGPDMSLWIARTLSEGRRGGVLAMLGTNAGCLCHTALATLGLSAVLAASVTAFTVLKIAGALYLGWLAVEAVRTGSALTVDPERRPPRPALATFLTGLGINLTNPKVVLFFLTFLPQFVAAHDPAAPAKMLFLGLVFVLVNVPLSVALILGAERLVGWLRRRPGVLRGIDLGFAGVFGFFACRILATAAR